ALATPRGPGELRNEFGGIHEHRAERRVARALEMQQQQARLRRDRDLHLLREDESPASLEMLVPQEYLHQSKQALALVRAQPASERDVRSEEHTSELQSPDH